MPTPPPPPTPAFCTVIEARKPKTKMHRTLGHAKAAFWRYDRTCRREVQRSWGTSHEYALAPGQLYRWDSDAKDWVVLYDIKPGTFEAPWGDR
jgi:hypothetical protein